MIRISILCHKDGDKLAIVELPRWVAAYQWLCERICPCHGMFGWILEKVDKLFRNEEGDIFAWFYSKWNTLYFALFKKEKTLFETPIESGCQASLAIWNTKQSCWNDNCEYCWEYQEDAMKVENETGRT